MHSGKHSQSFKYAYIQNNLAHYNQMLATRAVVDSRRKKERDLSNNHKHDKQVDSERRTLNNILLTKLIDIRDKPQSIMKLTMMADVVEPRRRCSLKNDFREKQKQRELNRNNLSLVKRIRQAKPGIGTINEWQRHENRLQDIRHLRRSTDDQLQFQQEAYNTFTDLLHSSIRTRFKLVNHGTRYGQPLKVEVQCQIDPQKKFRKRKRRTKHHRHRTSPIHVDDQQPCKPIIEEERRNTELMDSL